MASKRRPARLKSRKDFEALRSARQVVAAGSWLAANIKKNNEQDMRVGYTIPSYVGTAVIRNRLKRWIREFLNKIPPEVLEIYCDVNLVFRRKNAEFFRQLKHEELDVALDEIFRRIQKLR